MHVSVNAISYCVRSCTVNPSFHGIQPPIYYAEAIKEQSKNNQQSKHQHLRPTPSPGNIAFNQWEPSLSGGFQTLGSLKPRWKGGDGESVLQRRIKTNSCDTVITMQPSMLFVHRQSKHRLSNAKSLGPNQSRSRKDEASLAEQTWKAQGKKNQACASW
jgi:hypothetical protein